MNKKTVVLTGGVGFIGTNLAIALNNKGVKNIILVDHLSPRKKKNIEKISFLSYYEKTEFLKILNKELLPKPSIFIHLGACSDTSMNDKEYLLKNNTEYSKSVFNYCKKNDIRFIYASSAATYGNGARGYSDHTRDLKPLSYYGLSKYLFDEWILRQKTYPPQWVGLKFFNVYGPHEEHKGKMASVIYHGFNQYKKDGKIRLFKSYMKGVSDGDQKRDFIYVDDVINVIIFFLNKPHINGLYNVGSGQARTFYDLATALFKAMDKTPHIEFIEMPKVLREKYQYFTEADMSNLRSVGYGKAFYSLEEGILNYVNNYLSVK